MCLDFLDPIVPTNKGYKIFHVRGGLAVSPFYSFGDFNPKTGLISLKFNKWYHNTRTVRLYCELEATNYLSGFHCFYHPEDALDFISHTANYGARIYEVSVKDITATGSQNSWPVFIANAMKIGRCIHFS